MGDSQANGTQSIETQTEGTDERVIDIDVIEQASRLADLDFTVEERELMLDEVKKNREHFRTLRTVPFPNSLVPALRFDPVLPTPVDASATARRPLTISPAEPLPVPDDLDDLAFYPVTQLARLIQTRQVTSMQLTEMYLARLQKYDPALECVITLTEELAFKRAKRADEEIAQGIYRGPLHGIPWGAKDLLAAKGYPTTWGAKPYQNQEFDLDATVVRKLDEAGAVLVAKLSMGALAWGDVWFGGNTKSPWNLDEGSSGSSAGSGAAAAAGLVGFAIGTETRGSIVAPSHQCGTSGLRPTFGRVSRYGAMTLCWSLDKIGPMCRSVEDCALVFDAIRGQDGMDATVIEREFAWQPQIDVAGMRIGYVEADFEKEYETHEQDNGTLTTLGEMGAELVPIQLPHYPIESSGLILWVEAAAAFDEMTRSNLDDELVRQVADAWPNVMRVARMIPAVEYIQANRMRMLVMQAMAELMETVDLYVAPSRDTDNLWLTNATGHPAVVVPNGFRANGLPSSITFTGHLYDEARLLAVAKAYQDATGFHLKQPIAFMEGIG